MITDKFLLKMTCSACPEQYDVFLNGEEVGYLRLRHGIFRADCKEETVYMAHPMGDGMFDDDEREFYLNQACKAIKDKLENVTKEVITEKLYTVEEY